MSQVRWTTWIGISGLALGCAGWIGGCRPATATDPLPPTIAELDRAVEPATPLPEGEPAPHVVVALSLGDRGGILPCDCPDGVAGGWARKATLLTRLRGHGPLVAVAGPESLTGARDDPTAGRPAPEAAAARTELLVATGIDVLALGAADVAPLSAEDLRALADAAGAPLVATNLRDAAGAAPLPTVYAVQRADRRIAVLSVIEPTTARLPADDYTLAEPREAMKAALGGLEAAPDVVIVLSDAPDRLLPDLAARLHGADFVVGIAAGGERRGVLLQDGARMIRELPGGTQVGLLDLVFSGDDGAPLVDDTRVRDIAEQRLLALADQELPDTSGAAEVSPGTRAVVLGRKLPVGVVPGHAWGYRGVPLMADLPPDEGIEQRLGRL